MTLPLGILESVGAPAAPEPAFWQRSVSATANTATGDQDITVSGLGFTPKLAIIITADPLSTDLATSAHGSYGMTDGTNQFVCHFLTRGGLSSNTSTNYRHRNATDKVVLLDGNSATLRASFVQFINGGVRINISNNSLAQPYNLVVHLFGGTDFTAKVGVFDTTTSPVAISTGFQPDAIMFASGWDTAFSDTQDVFDCWNLIGFASYDGSTLRQVATCARAHVAAATDTRGGIVTTGCYTLASLGGSLLSGSISAIDATSFTVTNSSTTYAGYCAMNFGGAAQAWAGTLSTPTATGLQNMTGSGAAFTPSVVLAQINMTTTAGSVDTAGGAGSWGLAHANDNGDEMCAAFRTQDNVSTTDCGTHVSAKFLDHDDHTGALAYDATFDSFVSGGVRANYATANGTSRLYAGLLIGPT